MKRTEFSSKFVVVSSISYPSVRLNCTDFNNKMDTLFLGPETQLDFSDIKLVSFYFDLNHLKFVIIAIKIHFPFKN